MKRSMVVSIIGRPNVGKSTVYNRLMGRAHKNITHDMPGVTRDRHYGLAKFDHIQDYDEREAILIDTGGFYPEKMEEPNKTEQEKRNYKFFNIMIDHAKMAVRESDLVLLVTDIREGLLPFDEGIVKFLREEKKKFWIVVNKYDSDKQMGDEADFYTVGVDVDDIFMTSAVHGRGTDELSYRIQGEIIEFEERQESEEEIAPKLQTGVTPREQVVSKVALVGAPNAGKSTLLNCLIGAERALVSNIPGTTVDPIEGFFDLYFGKKVNDLDQKMSWGEKTEQLMSEYEEFRNNNFEFHQNMMASYNNDEELLEPSEVANYEMVDNEDERIYKQVFESSEEAEEGKEDGNYWRTIHLVDTAGIRRKKSIDDYVEEQSVFRSLRSITEADVVIYLVDAEKGIGHQDRRLIDVALEKGKSIILALNKVDLLKDKLRTKKDREEWLKDLRIDIPWLEFCDIVPISAKYKQKIGKLKKVLADTILIRNMRIPTGELNQMVFNLVERNPIILKKSGGKRLKVKYSSMIKANPPTFLLFTNRSKGIPENYKRYLKNGIRGNFALKNSPIHLIFRTGSDLEKRAKGAR